MCLERESMDHPPITFADFPSERLQSQETASPDRLRVARVVAAFDVAVGAEVVVVGLVFAPFTGGLSLVLSGAGALYGATVGVTAAARGYFTEPKMKDRHNVERVKELFLEFCDAAEHLVNIDKEKRYPELVDVMSLQSLMDQLLDLRRRFTSKSTFKLFVELTGKCSEILEQLHKLRDQFRAAESKKK
ncbi:hypothetical protein WMY93_014001 [Mugilogobius chulae]|uniref:Uncharacterized protein n=1 Tax=Mugilogobius chulae TaxID=88201 RepID=A0AAW0NTS1_9GOBI